MSSTGERLRPLERSGSQDFGFGGPGTPDFGRGGRNGRNLTVSEGQALRFFGTAASGPRRAKRGGSDIFGWQALFASRYAGGHSGQDVKSILTVVATGGRRFPKRWLRLLVNKVGVRIGAAFFGRS